MEKENGNYYLGFWVMGLTVRVSVGYCPPLGNSWIIHIK